MADARARRRLLLALTAVFVGGGLLFALWIPLFQGADEASHVDRLRFHAEAPLAMPGPDERIKSAVRAAAEQVAISEVGDPHWETAPTDRPRYKRFAEQPDAATPAAAPRCYFACQSYQYAHPPLYYVLLAPLTALLENFAFSVEMLFLRIAGVLLVAPVVGLTWIAAVQVWGVTSGRSLAAAAVMASFGPVVADSATVNNNGIAVLFGAVTVACTALMFRRWTATVPLVLGAAVGLGLLAKGQFVAIAPVAAVGVAVAAPAGRKFAALVRFAVPSGIGALWWLANLVRDGSLTPGGSEILPPEATGPWNHAGFPVFAIANAGRLLQRFWGSVGDHHGEVAGWMNVAAALVLAVLAVAWLAIRRPRVSAMGAILGAYPLLLAIASLYASYEVWQPTGVVRGLAGRYLYPVAPLLAIAAVAAVAAVIEAVTTSHRRAAVIRGGLVAVLVVGTADTFVRVTVDVYRTWSPVTIAQRVHVAGPGGLPFAVGALIVWVATVAVAARILIAAVPVSAPAPERQPL